MTRFSQGTYYAYVTLQQKPDKWLRKTDEAKTIRPTLPESRKAATQTARARREDPEKMEHGKEPARSVAAQARSFSTSSIRAFMLCKTITPTGQPDIPGPYYVQANRRKHSLAWYDHRGI